MVTASYLSVGLRERDTITPWRSNQLPYHQAQYCVLFLSLKNTKGAAPFAVLLQLSALKSFTKWDVTSTVPPFLGERPTAVLLLMLMSFFSLRLCVIFLFPFLPFSSHFLLCNWDSRLVNSLFPWVGFCTFVSKRMNYSHPCTGTSLFLCIGLRKASVVSSWRIGCNPQEPIRNLLASGH